MAPKNDKTIRKKSDQSPQPTKKTKKIEAEALVRPSSQERGLTIVGIGASAGGLKVLGEFFESLPGNTGMVYVVITHLHPEHESHMAELLQRHTQMSVQQVNGLVHLEKDHVYVIPPNRRLVMEDSQIDTADFKEPRGQRAPIDYFFRSLAQGHPNAVGIILSGGGTDGAVGVKAIKEEGGLLMVQHPDEAEYNSMPNAAIATGLADVILPVKGLARKLVELTRFQPALPSDATDLTEKQQELIRRIIAHVHTRTGHDFSQYKRSTLLRRIQRRMQIHGLSTLETYLDHLRQNPAEASALFNDILIGVTSFFRDRESWDQLATQVIPAILLDKGHADMVRFWVIGCSTGEEAYGLAILFFEATEQLELRPAFQIFASDLDEKSIRYAREGLYPTAIEADVSPERLERFFTHEGDHYRVRRELRDAVLFTHHSVLRDAPFSRQDLISCRNLLIYLERGIQDNVFDIFHYALKPGGFLFLGNSESAESSPELFQPIDQTHHIYQTKAWGHKQPHIPSLPLSVGVPSHAELFNQPYAARRYAALDAPRLAEEHARALEEQAPPSMLVNEKHAILHVSETVGRYLLQPGGPITVDVLKLVRPELQLELRAALFHVFENDQAVLTPPVPVRFNGHPHRVIMSVRPYHGLARDGQRPEKQALILFLEDEQNEPATEIAPEEGEARKNALARQQEHEVRRLREQLQASLEQSESSSEELKASNEELQSINEEYRSATEELETSKEELLSVNEELMTVNNELKTKLNEISHSHSDLQNLLGATEIAMLFLDRDLRIRHYTPGMRDLFNIMPGDRGRPIQHLTHTLQYDQFLEDAETVLRALVPIEREVQGQDGGWFLVRLRPYRTTDDRIDGVIFTFVEITRRKQADAELVVLNAARQQQIQERIQEVDEANRKISQARDLFFAIFDTNPIPTVLIRQRDEVFLHANGEFLNYFGVRADEVIGRDAAEFTLALGLQTFEQAELRTQLQNEGKVRNLEIEIQHPSGESRTILASLQYLVIDETDSLITTFIDITERARAERQVRALASELTATEQAERHRLSQILHDDLQQRIFAVQMQMSFLKDAYEKNDLRAFEVDFPQLEEWLAEAIKVTRQLSVDLSPPILHGEGLIETVIWLAAQMNEQYGLKVDIKSNGPLAEIDERVRVLTFYAVRELLFNIVKHAGTLEAAIRFEHTNSHLLVIVRDYGTGFEIAKVLNDPRLAHGLLVIRDRLNLLGCKLEINSQRGSGTEAIIEVPYGNLEA